MIEAFAGTLITPTVRESIFLVPDEHGLCDPRLSGSWLRAYCHLHGSDHQRSLSINPQNGWGRCFQCQRRVLVEAWNPEAARSLRLRSGIDVLDASRPVRRKCTPARPISLFRRSTPTAWQREELAELHACMARARLFLACGNTAESRRAQAYLQTRGIPAELAVAHAVGYLPASLVQTAPTWARRTLARWQDRLLFPLHHPGETGGYLGRSLWHWTPGMDEEVHREHLTMPGAPRRWLKTNPAGWFGPAPQSLARWVLLVEGAFDRLALLAAGVSPREVIALGGTSVDPVWFPPQLQGVILALDADEAGLAAQVRLARSLHLAGKRVMICTPPPDGLGKDWSTRWLRAGRDGVEPALMMLHRYSAA